DGVGRRVRLLGLALRLAHPLGRGGDHAHAGHGVAQPPAERLGGHVRVPLVADAGLLDRRSGGVLAASVVRRARVDGQRYLPCQVSHQAYSSTSSSLVWANPISPSASDASSPLSSRLAPMGTCFASNFALTSKKSRARSSQPFEPLPNRSVNVAASSAFCGTPRSRRPALTVISSRCS